MVQRAMKRPRIKSGAGLLLAAMCCVLWAVTCYAQTRLGPLGAGLTCNPAVYNPGTAPVIADCPLAPQLFYDGHSSSCTINTSCGSTNDGGKLLTATASGVTFTVPAPGGVGSATYSFGYNGNAYSITSVATINGNCGPVGNTLSLIAFSVSLTSDGINWQCTPFGWGSSILLNNYLTGLVPSNDGTSPNTVIDVTRGQAADDTNAVLMALPTAFTKTLSATVFSAGTAGQCHDTAAALAVSTWYYLFLIASASGTPTDILCSASIIAPTLPSGYTLKRWIGEVATASSGSPPAIRAFQTTDGHLYKWQVATYQGSGTIGNAQTLVTLDLPLGVSVEPVCRVAISGTTPVSVLITDPYVTDATPVTTTPFGAAPGWDKAAATLTGEVSSANCPVGLLTNTSGQVAVHASAASTTVNWVNRGWRQ
jgi:hypothetical protein